MHIEPLPYRQNITELFQAFANETHAVLLDSGKPSQAQGRFDIFSAFPSEQIVINNSNIQHLSRNQHKEIPNLHDLKKLLSQRWNSTTSQLPFSGGWIGFNSYEIGYWLEPASGQQKQSSKLPQFWAGYYQWAIIIDHEQQHGYLVYETDIDKETLQSVHRKLSQATEKEDPFKLTKKFNQNLNTGQYQQQLDKIQHYLNAGDCYQVNFAMQYQAEFRGSPFSAYKKLRQSVPSPFMSYLNLGKQQILSISPERFIQANGQQVQTKPIKGTAPRLPDNKKDQSSASELQKSTKNRAENLMIVDLLRNDFGHHCTPGSIKVDKLFDIESFSNVHHLVSTISGTIGDDSNIWDLYFDCLPGGSITGAPKIRACQIINELEDNNREIYCGGLFYAGNNGRFDSNIAIRTLLCEENTIQAWAGGGIVKDSEAEDEYQECRNKIGRLLRALEDSETD